MYYKRSLSSKIPGEYEYGRAVTMFNIGNAYRRSGDHEQALEFYEKSKRIADSLNFTSLSGKNLKALVAVYEASKKFKKADELQHELDSLDMSSISIEFPVSENEMDLDNEKTQEILSKLSEEALKRKDLVEKESNNKVADLYISTLNKQYMREQNRSRMFLFLSIGLGVVLVLTIFFAFRGSRKKKETA
jgi:tetratricopeptide (TPR) repeat protein